MQITENSTSNSEERARGKLFSTQSEPGVTAAAVPCNGGEDEEAAEVNGVSAADEGIHDTASMKDENGMRIFQLFITSELTREQSIQRGSTPRQCPTAARASLTA